MSPLTTLLSPRNPLLLLSPRRPLPFKTLALNSDHHGPSLRRLPSLDSPPSSISRDDFTRTFDLAALRVPADAVAPLERQLRGHLLNWPRFRNIARIPGDDDHPLLRVPNSPDPQRLASLTINSQNDEVAPLGPVLYRDKLSREFNCRGFLNFPNLAKISRPKKTKSDKLDGERERGLGKGDFAVVEVVGEEVDDEGMRGLLGEDFQVGTRRGPRRLLLLDERYAGRSFDELPEAVKVVGGACLATPLYML